MTWYRTTQADCSFLGVNRSDLQVLNRHLLATHSTAHSQTLKHPLHTTRTDRTRHAQVIFVTMAGWTTAEVMALHHTLETLTLRSSCHFNKIAHSELR